MRIAASLHQTKGNALLHALLSHGHEFVTGTADAFLIDLDTKYNKPLYEPRLARGEKVFLYPHAYYTAWLYDGCMEADERVTAHFVIGEGVREIYRRIGMTVPTYAIGYPWTELKPFRPCASPRKVLFAPEHALANGYIPPTHAQRNRAVFDALRALGVELTVRHVGELEAIGLAPAEGVTFTPAESVSPEEQIDAADVVVAIGSFFATSVARGAPTVTFDQREVPENENADGTRWTPESYESYRDIAAFPIDFEDGPIGDLLVKAATSDEPIRRWRELFIGEPFDPEAFAKLFDELSRDVVNEAEVRPSVVVALADEVIVNPGLIARYAQALGDRGAGTTLVIYAPGADEEAVVPGLQAAIASSGVPEAELPDMLLTAMPSHEVHERALARRACAVLTDRGVDGPLADLPSALEMLAAESSPAGDWQLTPSKSQTGGS